MQTVVRALPPSTADAAMLSVLLTLDDGQLTLFGTDNRLSITHRMKVDMDSAGKAAARGDLLADVMTAMQTSKSDRVECELGNGGRLALTSSDASYHVAGADPLLFPLVPPLAASTRLTLGSNLLREMVRKTVVVAPSGAGAVQAYEEVLVECGKGEVTMVATDAVRLALRTAKLPDAPDRRVLVPSHALSELARVLSPGEEVAVAIADDQISFSFGSTELRARLSEKTFPNYRAILPRSHAATATLHTREFNDNIRGVIPLARETRNKIYVEFEKERLILTSSSPELGEARREVEASLEGEPIKLAFNGKFLLDFLSVVDTEGFRWGVTSATYPATLSPDAQDAGYTYILMPITH